MTETLGVAAFDFDRTLVDRHTLFRFLIFSRGVSQVALGLATSAPRAPSRSALKLALLRTLFRGMEATRLAELGAEYATQLSRAVRPEMRDRVQWHHDQGHATVIVSGALATYLRPVGRELGMNAVLGVELLADASGTLTGEIAGGTNTRGPEKPKRLNAWLHEQFGPDPEVELWAYGDNAGDREMLAKAHHPIWVDNKKKDLREKRFN